MKDVTISDKLRKFTNENPKKIYILGLKGQSNNLNYKQITPAHNNGFINKIGATEPEKSPPKVTGR